MFPKRLKNLRTNKGLSQQEIASFIGISRQGYGKYEDGKSEPDLKTLVKLSDYFDVTTDFLLGNIENTSSLLKENNGSIQQIKQILKKYNLNQSRFFNIEKWKNLGPEEIKQLESYFEFIVQEAEKKQKKKD